MPQYTLSSTIIKRETKLSKDEVSYSTTLPVAYLGKPVFPPHKFRLYASRYSGYKGAFRAPRSLGMKVIIVALSLWASPASAQAGKVRSYSQGSSYAPQETL
jgi:hypothetical protein